MGVRIIVLLIGLLCFPSCNKDCDTTNLAPGRYTDECACDDGGINFHGECISVHARTFHFSYDKLCAIDLAVVLDSSLGDCDLQYNLDGSRAVIPKCGSSLGVGEISSSNLDCPNADAGGFTVYYSYTIPEPDATEIQINFLELSSPEGEELGRYTVIAPLL